MARNTTRRAGRKVRRVTRRQRQRQGQRQGQGQRTFSKKEYNSGNGMMTSVWGPAAWHLLHTIGFNYPVHPTAEDKRKYRKFLISFGQVLPCGKCRNNFCETLARMPLTASALSSRDCFAKYIYRLHNDVNARLQKTQPNPTFCDVRDQYEVFRARCGTTPQSPKKKNKTEKGCTEPLKGIKTKCLIRIVPKTQRASTFKVHPSCSCKKRGGQRGGQRGGRTRRAA